MKFSVSDRTLLGDPGNACILLSTRLPSQSSQDALCEEQSLSGNRSIPLWVTRAGSGILVSVTAKAEGTIKIKCKNQKNNNNKSSQSLCSSPKSYIFLPNNLNDGFSMNKKCREGMREKLMTRPPRRPWIAYPPNRLDWKRKKWLRPRCRYGPGLLACGSRQ